MAVRARGWLAVAGAGVLTLCLAYLRDPPWLATVSSGLSAWETDDQGTRYRWTRGHASFFVPADAGTVILSLRSVKDAPSDWPITATISIDDRPARAVTLGDDGWLEVRVRLPRPENRAHRRVDIVLDRVRSRQRGVQLQAVRVE